MENESVIILLFDQVKILIEHCMMLYMTRREIVNQLQNEANIEPEITETFWQRLEQQNPDFFKSYYTRLALKQQIEEFNRLLKQQKQLMDEEEQIDEGLNPNNMQHGMESRLSNMFNNDRSSFGMADMFAHGDNTTMPYIQNSNGESSSGMVDMSSREDIPVIPHSQNSNGESSSGMVDMSSRGDIPLIPHSQNSNDESSSGMVEMSSRGDIPVIPHSQNSNGESSSGMVEMSSRGDISVIPHSQNSNGESSFDMVDMSIDHEDISITPYSHNLSSSPHMFGSNVNVNEVDPNVGNASATSITSANSTLHSVNESVVDRPYNYLDESLSRKFSFSDIFGVCSDAQQNYPEAFFIDS